MPTISNCQSSADTVPWSFEEWWPVVERAARSVAQTLVGPDDADDVCQHVALRAFQRERPFHDCEHARAWAMTVAKNACRDLFRRRKRSHELNLDDETWNEMPAIERAHRDPEAALLTKELDALLRTSVRMLPPLLRDAAALHFLDGQPHESVATHLHITVANARKRIQNARMLLRNARRSNFETLTRRATISPFTDPVVHALLVMRRDGSEADVEIALRVRPRMRDLEQLRNAGRVSSIARRELAHALVAAGELEQSISIYRTVVATDGEDPQPWIELSSIQYALGESAAAAATCVQATEHVRRGIDCQLLIALAHQYAGDRHGALIMAAELTRGLRAGATHWRVYAEMLLASGKPHDAARAAEHALRIDPREPLAPSILHDAQLELRRLRAATASVLGSHHVPGLERLLATRVRARHLEGAEELLQALPPERAATYHAMAAIEFARGRPDDALRILDRYIADHPRHDGAKLARAELLARMGDHAEALRTLHELPRTREALRIEARVTADVDGFVQDVRAHHARDALMLDIAAMALLRHGDEHRAAELLREAIELQPQWPRLRRHLARATHTPCDANDDYAAFSALQCGDARGALDRCDVLAFADPAAAFLCRGMALRQLEQPADALIAFCVALELQIAHPLRAAVEQAMAEILQSTSSSQHADP